MTTASPHETGIDELDERRLQVLADQVAGVRWQVALTAVVIAAVAWSSAPPGVVIAWVAAVLVSRELRSAALVRMASDRDTPIAERLRATVRWNFVIGACYGLASVFMVWMDTTLDAVLTMILVSLGAGGVSVSATVIRAYIAYAAPMFVPIALMWVFAGPWLGWAVATLVLLFFGVQMRFARGNLATFEQSFRIRLENEALARHLAAERTELERARDAAVQANREKSRFLAAASHDLRQPLQALTLNSGELARLPLQAEARAMAHDIGASVEQLRSTLDALLDISKLDAGVVVANPIRVRLDVLLDRVAASFRAAAAARGLVLRTDCPAGTCVVTDPDLLRRMLANLIDNAIKFTRSGSVEIAATIDDNQVDVSVRDSGPGIAPEHHRLIFEDLVRLPARDGEAPQGHGLGLGIVRRAAAMLGLQIRLDSAPDQGATFRWRMPLAKAEPLPAATSRTAGLAGRRVLVLDDDSMVRGAYANALAHIGAQALPAATLAEALPQALLADAAVVDWRLAEDGDGFDAIEQLRHRHPDLPVVMVTADTGPDIADAARDHGVPLLRKPVDIQMLEDALSAALSRKLAPGEPTPTAGAQSR